MMLLLAAIGAAVAAAGAALHALWHRRARHAAIAEAGWTLTVAALAILYAVRGGGWPPRRSAVAFILASWATRRAIQILYTRVFGRPEDQIVLPLSAFLWRALAAFGFCLPALAACVNPRPEFSMLELLGAGLWTVGFAAEASDRRRLRHVSLLIHVGYVVFAAGSFDAVA